MATKSKATIYDVAARAGVAISTVSRVLNDSSDVSAATRQRVMEAIGDLEFRPDRTAKTLAQKQARALCVALPSFTTPFHNELLKGVRIGLRDLDFDLLLCDLGSATPRETLLRFLKRGTLDGLLLAGMPVEDALAAELRALRAPVVLVGQASEEFDSYVWDDEAGAYAATRHLTEQGHRRIAFIKAHHESAFQSGRMRGYERALSDAGLGYDEALVRAGVTEKHAGFSEEAGYEAMQALLTSVPDLTAVFASSDVQAVGALCAAREAGRVVGRDLALVGYDDVKQSRYIGLSSVDQGIMDVGARAMQRLIERVLGQRNPPPERTTTTPTLRVRETSRHARG